MATLRNLGSLIHASTSSAKGRGLLSSRYMDDCAIFASKQLLEDAKAILNNSLKLKELGKAQWLLDMEVVRNQD